MKRHLALFVLALIAVAILAGCTDKTADNPTRPVYDERGYVIYPSSYHMEPVQMSTNGEGGSKGYTIYTPYGLELNQSSRPYPILYILSPFRQNELYFYKRGLDKVADRLIQEGKIEPMIIVTIDGQSLLGASFYANSLAQGHFFTGLFKDTTVTTFIEDPPNSAVWQMTALSLKKQIEEYYGLPVLPQKENHAICGVGVGGYGAMKAAIETDMFGSVSAVNAPLDFDGTDGNGGFRQMMENSVIPGMIWPVDTSLGNEVTSLMVSASAAFASHPKTLDTSYYTLDQFGLRVFNYVVDEVLTTDLSTLLPLHNSHMPFDASGISGWDDFIWGEWMKNNVDSLYAQNLAGTAATFDVMPKLLITSDEAKFGFDQQMDAFIDFASGNNISYTHQTFMGTSQLDATASNFMYDLLEDILIFHSGNFDIPDDI